MEIRLPDLGEGVTEGEMVRWLVQEGAVIEHDQPLCEIMTDKATVEIPAPVSGKVAQLKAKEGDTILVGEPLLLLEGGAKQAVSKTPVSTDSKTSISTESIQKKEAPQVKPKAGSAAGAVLAAPSTRRFAREHQIALEQVPGTGPHGRILKKDIEHFLSANSHLSSGTVSSLKSPSIAATSAIGGGVSVSFQGVEPKKIAVRGLRRKIAQNMRLSKDRAAHFTYVEEADVTALVRLREKAKQVGKEQGVKVTYIPFMMKAMVAALKKYPHLNAHFDDENEQMMLYPYVHMGLSVQTDDGLIVPVVRHVEQKSILDLARDITSLVQKAREKKLSIEDVQGGTITLTSIGSIGGLFATPIIHYPEVAILGLNKIFKKVVPVEKNGKWKLKVRDWTYLSISLDHRVIDGAVGAWFLKELIRYLENPSLLLLEGSF